MLELTHWLTRLKVAPEAGADLAVADAERRLGREMADKLSMAALARAWQILLKGATGGADRADAAGRGWKCS